MKNLLYILFFVSVFFRLWAVPAYPYPVVFTQPNGEQVLLIMKGDEFNRFAQTLDGYTLLYNAEGYFCYAQQNTQGDIVPSDFYAEDIFKRNDQVNKLLAGTSKELRFSQNQLYNYQDIRNKIQREGKESGGNTTGTRKLLTILMQYPDKPFIKTQEDFYNLFNQLKYTEYGANGSVKDFFLECSYNQLEVQTTVVGPFTAKNNHAYYGDFSNARELAKEAVLAAHSAGVDFSDFAVNGEMPSFYMIFAGNGQEAGAGTDCIWSHAWSIDPVLLDGVWVSSYACSPEHRGANSKNITWIGVICHEFGHSLGAPDYYDTDYGDKGSYEGTGTWDLQAGGSWNDDGRTPAPPNPRSKIYTYGWASVTTLDSAQTVTIPSARIYDNAYFRINTQTPNEYFILENKIRGSYDDYIPGVNMLIYHCAADLTGMNTTSPQKFYPVSATAPVEIPGSGTNAQKDYGSINSGYCSWPGLTGKDKFTDTTVPAMISWNKQPTQKPITNITIHNNFITFDILGGGPTKNHTIFLPHYYGCSIIPEPSYTIQVKTGEDFKFKVILNATHNQSNILVKANGETIVPTNELYTISNIQSNQIVTIEGVKFNTVNITTSAGNNGKTSPGGIVEVPVNNVQHFDIVPNIGFSIDEVFVDGASVGVVNHYVFKKVTEPHTISARFKYGDKYIINSSSNIIEFATQPGAPSEAKSIIITSPGLAGSIQVVAPDKFEISNTGLKWYDSFIISNMQLPYQLYIRYNPTKEDRENALGKITLCSIEAYKEIVLIGNLMLPVPEDIIRPVIVYPNPTTGELIVKSEELRVKSVEVYDVYGRKVGEQKAESRKQDTENNSYGLTVLRSYGLTNDGVVINISYLPSGVYFIGIQTETGIISKKIIKQ